MERNPDFLKQKRIRLRAGECRQGQKPRSGLLQAEEVGRTTLQRFWISWLGRRLAPTDQACDLEGVCSLEEDAAAHGTEWEGATPDRGRIWANRAPRAPVAPGLCPGSRYPVPSVRLWIFQRWNLLLGRVGMVGVGA